MSTYINQESASVWNSTAKEALLTKTGWRKWSHAEIFGMCALIAVIIWIAHFSQSAKFGLYEDDYGRVPLAMSMTGVELRKVLISLFTTHFEGQGRPLHTGFILALSFAGAHLGGLPVIYLIGYLILTANACLFFALLLRLYNPVIALTSAIAFSLFPADTTQPFLTHALGIQPSITLFLLASHCYISGRIKLSYGLIFVSLFCYETIYPVFLLVPFFRKAPFITKRNAVIRHGLVLGGMLGLVFIIRSALGASGRIQGVGFKELLLVCFNIVFGPLVSLGAFPYRCLTTLKELGSLNVLNHGLLSLLPLCFIGFLFVFYRLSADINCAPFGLVSICDNRCFRVQVPKVFADLTYPAILGLFMTLLAYVLTFTTVADRISGRGSRVHTAASLGASLFAGCVCTMILSLAKVYRGKFVGVAFVAALFSVLTGFGYLAQREYAVAWQYERGFWTDVVRLCPDLTDGTLILLEPGILPPFRDNMIYPYSWSLPIVLDKIYQFPDSWHSPPAVYKLNRYPQARTSENAGKSDLTLYIDWVDPTTPRVESSNIIVLGTTGGQLVRRNEPLTIDGHTFRSKGLDGGAPRFFQHGVLYDLLIERNGERMVDYLSPSFSEGMERPAHWSPVQ